MSTALITGGSRGFGRALAAELARRDWNLVIDARVESDLVNTAEDLDSLGSGRVTAVPGSVADESHIRELVSKATRDDSLELLVNNASTLGPSPQPALADYPIEALRTVYEINVVAPLRLTQTAMPHLRHSHGAIVNITSDAAIEPYETWGGYGSSKAALEQISNILAAEEPDIRVYWFDPGDMNTRMHQEAFPGEDISDRPHPETRIPPLLRLLERDLSSGRYTASEFLTETTT